ncbi:MAG: Beta helix protein, partial [Bacteroidetes bacterium]|nr:Beta helix protein [Bacteroidota bacterium]
MNLLSSLLLTTFMFTCVQAQQLFVSPTGDDSNPGTSEKPFRTLERARAAVRVYHRTTPASNRQPFTVWLRGGTYHLTQTFELTRDDSGVPGAPVTYAAYEHESVRLSGGMTLPSSSFRPASGPGILRRLPPESRRHVVQADLRALGVRDLGEHRQFGHGHPVVPAPMELFWNDSVLQLARYPNSGAIDIGQIIDPGSVPRDGDYTERGGRFRYADSRHARWAGNSDVWLQGYFNHGFADDKIRIASIDTVRHEVTLSSP